MRIRSLDALRGVAALIVVFHHCALAIDEGRWHHFPFHGGTLDFWSWINRTPLCILIDGPASVLIFFALSGLVLARSMTWPWRESRLSFYTKRAARIWLPFAAAILVSYSLFLIIGPRYLPNYSEWFNNRTWHDPVNGWSLARQLNIMDGGTTQLDNPMWSLIHEARISLIFPIMAWGALYYPVRSGIISILMLPAALLLNGLGPIVASLAATGSYAFIFQAGAIMGTRVEKVRGLLERLPQVAIYGLWPLLLGVLIFAPYQPNAAGKNWHQLVHLLIPSVGAVMVVGLCTTENIVTRQLERPLPMWLGKISYSLYLIHIPILAAISHAWPLLRPESVACMTIVAALPAAWLLNKFIEKPAQNFGRWLTMGMRHAPVRQQMCSSL